MQAFRIHKGLVAPMDRDNVDTDAIIPKQFLKSIKRTGFGPNLFDEWRYKDVGEPGQDNSKRPLNPDFVLNQPRYQGASILLARKNFGCGSSREHAAWALNQYGFLAVIAPTFADIFFSNAGKNGIILVRLSEEDVQTLLDRCTKDPEHKLTINLEAQTVTDDKGFNAHFDIDPFRKYCLLNGLDDIGLTLRHESELDAFESKHNKDFWSAPKAATVS